MVLVVQTPIAEPPARVNMASIFETGSKNCNKHQHKEITGKLNSEKLNLPENDPWHNWLKPENASGTEVDSQ